MGLLKTRKVKTMIKLFSIDGVGTFQTRKRKNENRFGYGKGKMAYALHAFKRSFYFYPVKNIRDIPPADTFK